ncbi:amidohydrolase family protein [Frondihabitans sp. PAMC 28766]|uniref:amidohydrolase family protein n=1 Tax=Frondihabitans sp. PAMC 28766 TaxID=1795630 RepID=UPI000AF817AA|nr:amidohydrolase family protein [Frondihabitans sp. PAMC 28766]
MPDSTPTRPVILRAATVVDVSRGTLRRDVDVLIEIGRIQRIAPTGTLAIQGADVVDAQGRFVVPGFVDAHAHPIGRESATENLELMGAFGITGFRQMSGSPRLLDDRATGRLGLPSDGPSLLALPGDLLTPMNAGTSQAAVATLRAQKDQGADFVKVVSVSPAVLLDVLDEAARLSLPVAGHLPNGIDVREVSRRGMRCIEHLGPGVGITAATADDEPAILAEAAAGARTLKAPPIKLPGMGRMVENMLKKIIVNPVTANKEVDIDLLSRADATFDEDKARAVARLFVENETWQCPTLIRVRTQQLADDPRHTGDPELRFVSPGTVAVWQKSNEKYAAQGDSAHATYRRTYSLQLRLTKIFDEEGVPLLVGTDSGGAGWVIPGHAIHQEFDELAAAGLSPLSVLRAATSNAAAFFGTSSTQGDVAEGFDADLVLLGSDPLQSVDALHDIVGVVRAGRYRPASELDAVKERIAAARSIQ